MSSIRQKCPLSENHIIALALVMDISLKDLLHILVILLPEAIKCNTMIQNVAHFYKHILYSYILLFDEILLQNIFANFTSLH